MHKYTRVAKLRLKNKVYDHALKDKLKKSMVTKVREVGEEIFPKEYQIRIAEEGRNMEQR